MIVIDEEGPDTKPPVSRSAQAVAVGSSESSQLVNIDSGLPPPAYSSTSYTPLQFPQDVLPVTQPRPRLPRGEKACKRFFKAFVFAIGIWVLVGILIGSIEVNASVKRVCRFIFLFWFRSSHYWGGMYARRRNQVMGHRQLPMDHHRQTETRRSPTTEYVIHVVFYHLIQHPAIMTTATRRPTLRTVSGWGSVSPSRRNLGSLLMTRGRLGTYSSTLLRRITHRMSRLMWWLCTGRLKLFDMQWFA